MAIIASHAVNQDGRSSSLTAPSGPSQQALIQEAYGKMESTPTSCVSAKLHGTGTALGDPIEMGAAVAVYSSRDDKPLAFTADKAGMGHAEPAAGVASFLTGVSSLSKSSLQPLVHLRNTNPYVEQIFATKAIGARQPILPKQTCPMPVRSSPSDTLHHGSSGFAFQVVL
jgi:acyl transferase domain-containing protein